MIIRFLFEVQNVSSQLGMILSLSKVRKFSKIIQKKRNGSASFYLLSMLANTSFGPNVIDFALEISSSEKWNSKIEVRYLWGTHEGLRFPLRSL